MSDDSTIRKLPRPPGICDECLSTNTLGHLPSGARRVVTYCVHSKTGCVFEDGIWTCFSPVSETAFAHAVNGATDATAGGQGSKTKPTH